jgi:hypothetical protein
MDRKDFMTVVYDLLSDDPDNNRANAIIDAADQYAEDAVNEHEQDWTPVTPKTMPEHSMTCYVTIEMKNGGKRFTDTAIYTPQEGFDPPMSVRMGHAEIVAWKQKTWPEPWKGEKDA